MSKMKPEAYYDLGIIYFEGKDKEQDLDKATTYFRKANSEKSKEMLKKIKELKKTSKK